MAEDGKKMVGSYDIKVPEDTDVLLGYDSTANKVKNFKFSGIWTWLVTKFKGEKISDLNTTDKTVVGAIKEVNTPTFTQASARNNIASGETQSIIMGKIKKWFADLGTAAFCSVVNNLTTTAEGSVLDARQGKNLSDALTKLNTLMGSTDISGIGGGTLTGAINELNSKQFLSIPVEITIDSRVLKANLSYDDLAFGLLCVSFQIDDNVYANALICIGSRYDTKLLAFCGSNISKDNRVWDPASKTLSCVLEVDNHQIQLQKALLIQ